MNPRVEFVTVEGRQESTEVEVMEDDGDFSDVCLLAQLQTMAVSQVFELRTRTRDGAWTVFHKHHTAENTTWFCAAGVSVTMGLTLYEDDEEDEGERRVLIILENATALRGAFFDAGLYDAYFARRRQHLLANPYKRFEDGADTKHFPYPWDVDGIDGQDHARVFDALGVAIKTQ